MKAISFLGWIFVILIAQENCEAHYDASYFHSASDGFSVRQNWLSTIENKVMLSELALPGTHASAAYKEFIINTATQCLNFDEQLKYGIRVFDIRVRHFHNSFVLHRGTLFLNSDFDDFLRPVDNFLKINPSETVLFRFKNEHGGDMNTRSMRETLDFYLERYPSVLKTTNLSINLGQARGRSIILCDDTSCDGYGLNYNQFNIQDKGMITNLDLYNKWEAVKAQLSKAASGSRDTFYVNYLSASGLPLPYFVASGHITPATNALRLTTGLSTLLFPNTYPDFPRVLCILSVCTIAYEGTNVLTRYRLPDFNGTRSVGIIMIDFPGDSLIEQVIANNRNLKK